MQIATGMQFYYRISDIAPLDGPAAWQLAGSHGVFVLPCADIHQGKF
jgi:hypothetical protein